MSPEAYCLVDSRASQDDNCDLQSPYKLSFTLLAINKRNEKENMLF